jgi:hypothetical protein
LEDHVLLAMVINLSELTGRVVFVIDVDGGPRLLVVLTVGIDVCHAGAMPACLCLGTASVLAPNVARLEDCDCGV